MTTGRDGAVLMFSTRNGLLSYHQGRFTRMVGDGPELPDRVVLAMAQASDGGWWLGTRDGGIFRLRDGKLTRVDVGLTDVKINCLAVGPRGEIWIGTDSGVIRFADGVAHRVTLPATASPARALAMTRDRDDNIWIAAGAYGLLRVSADGRISHAAWDWRADGSVTAVFEDREGDLWLGTSKGIERWRDGVFTAFAGVHLPDRSRRTDSRRQRAAHLVRAGAGRTLLASRRPGHRRAAARAGRRCRLFDCEPRQRHLDRPAARRIDALPLRRRRAIHLAHASPVATAFPRTVSMPSTRRATARSGPAR